MAGSQTVVDAQAALKKVQSELVQYENRLDHIKGEYANLSRQKEVLQADIDKKVSDAQILLSTRDNESRQRAKELQAIQESLEKQKAEFVTILANFKRDQNLLIDQRKQIEDEKRAVAASRSRVDAFVVNLQKAYSVLG